MNNKSTTLTFIALVSLALVGCNSSSPGISNDGNEDNVGNGSVGGGSANGDQPSAVFEDFNRLGFSSSYSGSKEWANPSVIPRSTVSGPKAQEHRVLMDTHLLGASLTLVPHVLDKLYEHNNEVEDLYQFLGLNTCGGSHELNGDTLTLTNYCVRAQNFDNVETTISGTVTKSGGPEEFSRVLEFADLDVEWRSNNFKMSGALGRAEQLSRVYTALDVDIDGETYLFWKMHNFALNVDNPFFDMVSFNPDLGAVVSNVETLYASDSNCPGGGFEAGALSIYNDARAVSAPLNMMAEFMGCDVYVLNGDSIPDNGDNFYVIEPGVALSGLGMNIDTGLEVIDLSVADTYELSRASGPIFKRTQPEEGRIGHALNGDDLYYQIAFEFDLDPSQAFNSIGPNDVELAFFRTFNVDATEEPPFPPLPLVLSEWDGSPGAGSEFVTSHQDHQSREWVLPRSSLNHPWRSADLTDWLVEDVIDEGNTKLQFLFIKPILDGTDTDEKLIFLCLQENSDCTNAVLPTLSVVVRQ